MALFPKDPVAWVSQGHHTVESIKSTENVLSMSENDIFILFYCISSDSKSFTFTQSASKI